METKITTNTKNIIEELSTRPTLWVASFTRVARLTLKNGIFINVRGCEIEREFKDEYKHLLDKYKFMATTELAHHISNELSKVDDNLYLSDYENIIQELLINKKHISYFLSDFNRNDPFEKATPIYLRAEVRICLNNKTNEVEIYTKK